MNFNLSKKSIQAVFITLFLLYSQLGIAQLEVTDANTPPFTPVNLVENIFLGEGVDVLNVSYTGDAAAVGFFDGENSNIGIDRGILMTSGAATNAIGPNNAGDASFDNSGGSDVDLAAITGKNIFDAAAYTIDFIPYSDTLRFNYVFASEEYDEFVCAGVNDAFAFFIDGPGYPGPTNIALIPGTTTEVAIDNVNNGGNGCPPTNVQYYQNNAGGTTVQYDAFTTVLEATAVVTPCQTYSIKLVIGDAGDGVYDSGVFLQANSFGTAAIEFDVLTVSPDSTIREECAEANLNFTLAEVSDSDFPVTYSISGTATNGVDYTFIPDNLFIPAGQTELVIPIEPLQDNITEGEETIIIEVQTNPCKTDTVTIYLEDNNMLPPMLLDTMICQMDTIALDATLPVVLPDPITFTNSTSFPITDNDVSNPVLSPINVFGITSSTVTSGTILSVCIDVTHPWDGDIDVFLLSPNGQFLELTTDNGGGGDNYTQTCFTADASTFIEGLTAIDAPFTDNYLPEAPWSDLFGATVNGTWTLQISDDTNGFSGTLNSWSISFPPVYDINYNWTPASNITCADCPETMVFPPSTTDYIVVATDTYGCETSDTATVAVQPLLAAPTVTCEAQGSTIIFSWNDILPPNGYQVSVDGGPWESPNGILMHSISGTIGQTISIEVQGLEDPCEGMIGTASCIIDCDLISSITASSNVDCYGSATGEATVTPALGTMPYTYLWSDVSSTTTATISNLTAGTYTVTVTDDLGCTNTKEIEITQADSLSISLTTIDLLCNGENNGEATATVTGGTPNYTYLWSDASSQTTMIATGLLAGTYTVTATDDSGCTITESIDILEPLDTISATITTVDPSCNGGTDGSIEVVASGGTPNYEYNITGTPQTNGTFTGLAAGSYIVTITDANSCEYTESVTLNNPDEIIISITNTEVNCNGENDGTATATATGGTTTTDYSYLWSDANSQTTATATGLAIGTYTVTITDDNNCTATESITISEPDELMATTTAVPLLCNSNNMGETSVSATGGTMPYTYLWSNAGETTDMISNLSAGIYTVTVTDDNNCTVSSTIDVTEPTPLDLNITSSDVSCNGENNGEAIATVTGGTMPYTYVWSDASSSTTSTISNLIAGTYTITVTDDNNCTITSSVDILEPTDTLSAMFTLTDPLCFNGTDGSIEAVASGGTPNYEYNITGTAQTSGTFSGLAAGSYIVTITDANSCEYTESVTLNNPDELLLSITNTEVSCNSGNDATATITATGGTPNYTYLWSDVASQTTMTATGLTVGTYTVTVSDDNNCTATESVTISEPDPLQITPTGDDLDCNGDSDGTVSVTVTGGTSPYSYLWSDAASQTTMTATGLTVGTYTVTVTDDNNCTITSEAVINEPLPLDVITTNKIDAECNGGMSAEATASVSGGTSPYSYLWSDANSQTTGTAFNLVAGTYTVTITDGNGCTNSATTILAEPTALNLTVTSTTDLACFSDGDGTATVTASGGTPSYTFDIGNGNQASGFFTGLSVGDYTITVTDDNGCTATTIATISPDVTTAVIPDLNYPTTILNCNTTSILLDASASQGPTNTESFLWSDNSTNTTLLVTTPGDYTVTITDAGTSCTETISVTITQDITPPSSIITSPTTELNCNIATITLDASTSTGTGNLSYQWSDFSTDTNISINTSGTYTVTITDDSNGCTSSEEIVITENIVAPMANISSLTTELNCNINSIILDASTSTGGGSLAYQWSDMTTATSITVTTPNAYTVTVTDSSNGCTASATINITQNITNPSIIPNSTGNLLDCNITSLDIDVSTSIGTGTLSYEWTDGNTNSIYTVSSPGTYTVTVTDDNNGCSTSGSFTINQNIVAPIADIQAPTSELNCSVTTITLDASNSTGAGNLSYEWTGGSTGSNLLVTTAGDYTVTVTDSSNGCTASTSYTITQDISIPTAIINNNTSILTCTDTDIILDASSSTALGTLSYEWSDMTTNTSISVNMPGDYTVTITDVDNGCTAIATVTITQNIIAPDANITAPTSTLTCSTPSITLDASVSTGQGTLSYEWSDLSTNSTLVVSAPGIYTITVTDSSNGCTASQSIEILQNITAPNANITGATTELTCLITSITLDASVSTGQGTLSYEWSDLSTDSNIIINTPGTYTVTVTDSANGCTASHNINITQDLTIIPVDITSNNTELTCTLTSITLDAGLGYDSYIWSTGETSQTIDVSTPNDYTVTVTYGICTDEATISITQDLTFDVAITGNLEYCSGFSTTLNADTGLDSYLWSTGETSQSITIDSPNDYTVTATNGICTDETTVSIIELVSPTPEISGATEICSGTTETLDAGLGYDSYNWSNSQTSQFITITGGGTYTVTVTSSNGCTGTDSFIVEDAEDPEYNVIDNTSICLGGSIMIGTVEAVGNTYSWTSVPNDPSLTSPTSGVPSVSPTETTTYELTVTNGVCTHVQSVTIEVIDPSLEVVSPVFVCLGDEATLSATAGPAGGIITWSDYEGNILGTGDEIQVLPLGTTSFHVNYTIGNCSISDIVEVNVSQEVNLELSSSSGTEIEAGEGTILTVTGAPIGSTFVWSADNSDAPNGDDIVNVNPLVTTSYTVEVTTPEGCVYYQTIVIFIEAEELEMPNVFTPNNDDQNDRFYPVYNNFVIEIIEFKVFDRWGELVHDNIGTGWDGTYRGKEMSSDIYVYLVRYKIGDIEYFKKGDVALMR